MTYQPTVSICIPTHNQARYLAEAVESAYSQTYPNVEVWISDDASIDNTQQVARVLTSKYKNIYYFRQEQNVGIAQNVDYILRQPKTEFIVRLDSDDKLLPKYVEKLVKLFHDYPEAGYGHSDVQEIDKNGAIRRVRLLARKEIFQNSEIALKNSLFGYKVAANICMFRSKSLQFVNYISTHSDHAEDYDLAVRLADAGFGNVYCGEILACYRVWTDEKHFRVRRKTHELRGIIQIFNDSIEPAFRKRNWDIKVIHARRTALATHYALMIAEPHLSEREKGVIEELLKELGDSSQLRQRIKIINMGFGWYFHLLNKISIFFKDYVKQLMREFNKK